MLLISYSCKNIFGFKFSHFESFKPIKDSCTCLTCKKHTRSYIHHLLISKELLGSILLTM